MRSKLEERVDAQLKQQGIEYEYEPKDGKLAYRVPASDHKYLPDFVITTRSGKRIILEPKGIWDLADRRKHLLLRQQLPENDIRFVFQNAKQKIRKGSKTTYASICEGLGRPPFKGVTWQYSDKGIIPQEWLDE
tara:strand:+ start:5421 stop:5822 length:402 start_codon:yes stop_codon:yes gene_type:complete